MIELTLESIYALHILNDHSSDLPFLPLEFPAEETDRLTVLQSVLDKGYKELQDKGLIVGTDPTEECGQLGYYLKLYAEHYYHVQVDEAYFIAPQIDHYKKMAIVIQRVENNSYIINRFPITFLLGLLIHHHPILQNLDKKVMNYLKTNWQVYDSMRLLAYYGNNEGLRLRIVQAGKIYSDFLFVDTKSGLFQYDLLTEEIRAVSVEQMQNQLMKDIKIEV